MNRIQTMFRLVSAAAAAASVFSAIVAGAETKQRKDEIIIPVTPLMATEPSTPFDAAAALKRIRAEKPYALLTPRLTAEQLQAATGKAGQGDALAMDVVFYAHYMGLGTAPNQPKARQLLVQAFHAGGPIAILFQGMNLCGSRLGDTISPDARQKKAGEALLRKALEVFTPLATEGDPFAQTLVAQAYADLRASSEALEWARKGTEQGHACAQVIYGRLLQSQKAATAEDQERAQDMFSKAAEQKLPDGIFDLAMRHHKMAHMGISTEHNRAEAFRLKLQAAEMGLDNAQDAVGQCYLWGQGVQADPAKGIAWLSKAAEQENVAAMLYLAHQLALGRYVKHDHGRAARLLRKAAERSYPRAETAYGRALQEGAGVAKDERLAFLWFRRAADHGDHGALHFLMDCYQDGTGTEVDLAECIRIATRAIKEDGCSRGHFIMAQLYDSGEVLEKDFKKAFEHYEMAGAAGSGAADYQLGRIYETGRGGVPVDYEKAFRHYQRGAQEVQFYCCYRLGLCYLEGKGTAKNLEKARYWLRMIANSGIPDAAYHMAIFCRDGLGGLAKDEKEAANWLRRALRQGEHAGAEYLLGQFCEQGTGVPQDLKEAKSRYAKAAALGHAEAQAALKRLGEPIPPLKNKPGEKQVPEKQ